MALTVGEMAAVFVLAVSPHVEQDVCSLLQHHLGVGLSDVAVVEVIPGACRRAINKQQENKGHRELIKINCEFEGLWEFTCRMHEVRDSWE